jgi:serine/threonine-protein kinase
MLGDRYQLIDHLGGGETGEVWRAYDLAAGHMVAVKFVLPHLASDARLVDRLLRSRSALLGLWHPGIAQMLDVFADADGQVAVITELVDGVNLEQRGSRAIPVAEVAEIGLAMADALAEAHRLGFVHGALKPSNVVIPATGDSAAKLTDFSLELLIRAGRARVEESRYAAPEMIDGSVPAQSTDIYAFGVLLYDITSGLDEVPEALRQLMDECTDLDPAARPAAAEIGTRLRHLALPVVTPSRHSSPPPVRRRRPAEQDVKRSRLGLGIVVGSALVVVLVVVGVIVFRPGAGTAPAAQATPGPATTAAANRPPLPAAAAAQTLQGGQEFVRYWFTLLSYAMQSGDADSMNPVTRAECAQCATALTVIRQVHTSGGSMRGGAFTVRNVTTTTLWSPDRPIFDATLDRLPRAIVDSGGATVATTPGLTFANCVLVLEWASGNWRVYEVTTPGCLG